MGQRPTTCRACGAELHGRDVYEGICRSCRENEVLGAAKPRARGPRSSPAPAPPPSAAPPPDGPSVDMDADTKELLALGGGEAAAPPSPPTPPAPPSSTAAAGEAGTSLRFAEFESPEPKPRPSPSQSPAASSAADTESLGVELAEPELPVTEPADDEPTRQMPAEPAPEGPPPSSEEPAPSVFLGMAEPRLEPEQPAGPSARVRAARRPPPALPPQSLHLPDAPPSPADTDQATQTASEAPTPHPQPPDSQAADARPPLIRIAPDGPEHRPASSAPAPDDTAMPQVLWDGDRELYQRLETLSSTVDELAARVDRLAPSRTWMQQVGFGFRACFGFVLGLGVLALVGVGLLALVGKLFYPPAFELLRRAAGALFGG